MKQSGITTEFHRVRDALLVQDIADKRPMMDVHSTYHVDLESDEVLEQINIGSAVLCRARNVMIVRSSPTRPTTRSQPGHQIYPDATYEPVYV
ncbi:uncharacterized protein ColSpa_03087 [Colletotrichum spaethianum]|uniref:Uncharacterized protein n=1 Tax=Colletotrichum spaethianum TaxID=700344 RepID=A0AA37P552_9PEZI|nr:uncharacterized protein ColSpa_03087 [Colletotrichum spaethianum]GKT42906.1 hypothetical protein ColSpa_03087 [Colletotrichum spaethianum]